MKKKYYTKSWEFILVILFGFFLSSTLSFCLAAEKKVAKPEVPGVMIVSSDALVIRTSHDSHGKPLPCGWGGMHMGILLMHRICRQWLLLWKLWTPL